MMKIHHLVRTSMLVTLLLAFALRAYHLDFQSFWSDEGISLLRSGQPLGEMLRNMPAEHVPGYFVLLYGWLRLSGEHDFGMRFLSLWPSVLAVALLYRLGVDLGAYVSPKDREEDQEEEDDLRWKSAGLLGATLLAASGFQVWYAQEARMYSWLLASCLLAHLCLWRLLNQRFSWSAWSGYVVGLTLTVYLHFYGFLVPLTHTIFMVVWVAVTRKWRAFTRWLTAGATICFLFAPWLPRALGILEFNGWREAGDPWQIPWRYLTAYTVSPFAPSPWIHWLPWFYLALALFGILLWTRRRPTAALFLLVNGPVALLAVFLLALRNPDFHERYSIAISGPLLLLVAGGICGLNLRRWTWSIALPLFVLIALMVGNWQALNRVYHDETIHKPDFRGAAWRIAQQEQPGDVILVDGPDPEKVFLHYYDGQAPVVDLRPIGDANGEEIDRTLKEKTVDAERIWELLYFRGPGMIQQWLAQRTWPTAPSDHNGIRVTLYGYEQSLPEMVTELNIAFGDGLLLERAAFDSIQFAPGEVIQVTTEWQVTPPVAGWKFSLRMVNEAGVVALAEDYVPQNWFMPTSTWPTGPFTERRGILLPAGFAPGEYRITLRLYDPASGVALETDQGPDVLLGEIFIEG